MCPFLAAALPVVAGVCIATDVGQTTQVAEGSFIPNETVVFINGQPDAVAAGCMIMELCSPHLRYVSASNQQGHTVGLKLPRTVLSPQL